VKNRGRFTIRINIDRQELWEVEGTKLMSA
jgi:hypothetical protein